MQKRQPDDVAAWMERQPDDAGAWTGLAWILAAAVILILVGLGLCFCRLYDKPKSLTDGLAVTSNRALVSDRDQRV